MDAGMSGASTQFKERAQTTDRTADGEVAWSWRPKAGVKLA